MAHYSDGKYLPTEKATGICEILFDMDFRTSTPNVGGLERILPMSRCTSEPGKFAGEADFRTCLDSIPNLGIDTKRSIQETVIAVRRSTLCRAQTLEITLSFRFSRGPPESERG